MNTEAISNEIVLSVLLYTFLIRKLINKINFLLNLILKREVISGLLLWINLYCGGKYLLNKMVEVQSININDLVMNDDGSFSVVRQIKRGHIRQIKSGLIHGNYQKTVGLSSLISSDYKKKKLPMQIKTQAVS